jgi:hypothetical protein
LHEEIAKSHFISALGDRNLELKVQDREPKDLDAAFTIALQLETYQNAYCNQELTEVRSNRARYDDNLARRITAMEINSKKTSGDPQIKDLIDELEYERVERN